MYENRFWKMSRGILRVLKLSPLISSILPVKLAERSSTEDERRSCRRFQKKGKGEPWFDKSLRKKEYEE